MSKRRKKHQSPWPARPRRRPAGPDAARLHRQYQQARRLAERGEHQQARGLYEQLEKAAGDPWLQALVRNDLAAHAVVGGAAAAGRDGFQAALALDPHCQPARANLALVEADLPRGHPDPIPMATAGEPAAAAGAVKVAVLSFLFNWPSTGGGIIHTVELARFLARAGYDVRHFYARYPAWGVGQVEAPPPFPGEALDFDAATWDVPAIQARFRQAVDAFGPDHVILTDSWNMKPLLAEAVAGYPYLLRLQAMECLCPLNNLRLVPGEAGGFRQCPLNQLANPRECGRCVAANGHRSGSLHQAERALSGVGTPGYHARLLKAVREAAAVLVVNALTEELIRPYARCVRVVTAGMDPARFPWPWPEEAQGRPPRTVRTVFFAGLVEEWAKGFPVLHGACARLWQRRQDFELVATGDPPGRVDAFTRFVGWQSQADLPRHLRAADVCVLPAVGQEALGRTAVEAMAVGRPVVASRIGGLPATVAEGITGLLCEPGNADDLAAKLATLLDDPGLRQRLGEAGRRRFEEHYSWDVIIARHYQPLLGPPRRSAGDPGREAPLGAAQQ